MWKNLRKKLSNIHVQPSVSRPLTIPVKDTILCNCSNCEIESKGTFETLPLEDGFHTSCEVHKCKNCGRMGGFPESNLEIAMEKGTPETKQALRRVGIPVDEYITSIHKKNEISDEKLNPSRRNEK